MQGIQPPTFNSALVANALALTNKRHLPISRSPVQPAKARPSSASPRSLVTLSPRSSSFGSTSSSPSPRTSPRPRLRPPPEAALAHDESKGFAWDAKNRYQQSSSDDVIEAVLFDCERERLDCLAAYEETMTALTRMHWPNAPAGVAARALVTRVSRATTRLRATCERLENEAREMQRSHAAETKAAAQEAAAERARLVEAHEIAVAALRAEIEEYEAKEARQAQAVWKVRTKKAVEAIDVKHVVAMPRDAVGGGMNLEREIRVLSDNYTEVTEKAIGLEHKVEDLTEEKEKLVEDHSAELERMRLQMDALRKEASKWRDELTDSAAARGRLREELEAERASKKELEESLRLQLWNVDESRLDETGRLQTEIDHMHSLHKAALDAGAYKGRQMLYLDSLRPRPPRANDMENIDKVLARVGVSTSWRAEEERTEFAQKRLSRIGPDQKEPDPGPPAVLFSSP